MMRLLLRRRIHWPLWHAIASGGIRRWPLLLLLMVPHLKKISVALTILKPFFQNSRFLVPVDVELDGTSVAVAAVVVACRRRRPVAGIRRRGNCPAAGDTSRDTVADCRAVDGTFAVAGEADLVHSKPNHQGEC